MPPTLSPHPLPSSHLTTRFLFPFYFDLEAIVAEGFAFPQKPDLAWRTAKLPDAYKDERYESLWSNQFGTERQLSTAKGYFRLAGEDSSSLLGPGPWQVIAPMGATVATGHQLKASFNSRSLELFLPPKTGTGLISICLDFDYCEHFSWGLLQDLNYRLSRYWDNETALLSAAAAPLTFKNARALTMSAATVPAGKKQVRKPVEDRISPPNGVFSLAELAQLLLSPLIANLPGLWPKKGELQVYTAVRFPSSVTLSSLERPLGVADPRLDLTGLAASLSQVEESDHPLPPADHPGVHVQMLSTHHLAATSTQGAAHLIFDQGQEFDKERLARCLDQYFVDYLVAARYRGHLKGLASQARTMALLKSVPKSQLDALRASTTLLLTSADLLEVSRRDSHNRYFDLCKDAFNVDRHLEIVQRTISDFDANQTQQEAIESARQQTEIARHTQQTQVKVEWIEVFVVSVYSFELAESLGRELEFAHLYVAFGSAVVLIISFFMALRWVQPFGHREASESKPKPKPMSTTAVDGGRREQETATSTTSEPAEPSAAMLRSQSIFKSIAPKVLVATGVLLAYLAFGWFFERHGDAEGPPEPWIELRARAAGIPALREKMAAIDAAGVPEARSRALPELNRQLQNATGAIELREQAEAVCDSPCFSKSANLRATRLEAVKHWQAGEFSAAEASWKRVLDEALNQRAGAQTGSRTQVKK